MAQRNEVIDFETRRQLSAPETAPETGVSKRCLNPDCTVLIERTGRRGKPRDYHDDECQRSAAEVERKLELQHQQAAELLAGISSHLSRFDDARASAGKPLKRSSAQAQLAAAPVDANHVGGGDARAVLTELLVTLAGTPSAERGEAALAALSTALANPNL